MDKNVNEGILYSAQNADALTKSEQTESWRHETDRKKAEIILDNAKGVQSLLDIGCGWGQILFQLAGKIPNLAGVDESPERLAKLRKNEFGIKIYQANATDLPIDDAAYDTVLTSHVMHEFKLFGKKDEEIKILSEIQRVMKHDGRYFIIDHLDPGDEEVTIGLKDDQMKLLRYFIDNFNYRKVDASISGDNATLSKRDCQDFITKIWSFGGGAEGFEMRETHTALNQGDLEKDMKGAGFIVDKWITFNSIKDTMDYYSISLKKGEPWHRQFVLIAKL